MSHELKLDLPEDLYRSLQVAAAEAGQSLEDWVGQRLRRVLPRRQLSQREQAEALARLMGHAGAVDLGRPTGTDNEAIDDDLASEYGQSPAIGD